MSSPSEGEHRHNIGGMLRAHIPAGRLRRGQSVFVVPRDVTTPRGPSIGGKALGFIPAAGAALAVNDYLLGCAQRSAVQCYELAAEPVAVPQDEE